MTTERGNSACCMGRQLTVEPVSESHREAVMALAVRASYQQAICLRQWASYHWKFLNRALVTISEERFKEFLDGRLYYMILLVPSTQVVILPSVTMCVLYQTWQVAWVKLYQLALPSPSVTNQNVVVQYLGWGEPSHAVLNISIFIWFPYQREILMLYFWIYGFS